MKTLSAGRVRTAIAALLTAASFLAAPVSNAASPPGTPHVTVGADIKQLLFDWDDVTGAAYYRLLVQVGTSAFKPVIDNIPASTTQARLSIAVHLQNWANTRYVVAACNTSGCTKSAAVLPKNLMLDSIGYLKASNTDPGDAFGHSLVLSDDGATLAVVAEAEDSNASGVNGNQADNSSESSGAVYVFHRASSGWRQEAYLKAGVNVPRQFFGSTRNSLLGRALAINANGTLLAVGTPEQGGVAGSLLGGVVYIYQKSTSGSWSLVQTLASPNEIVFGSSVDMSLDGRTLKVDSGGGEFTHIYVRPGATWQLSATLTPLSEDVCDTTRLSGDGNTLVSACEARELPHPVHVETRKRSGNTWTQVSDMPLSSNLGVPAGLALDFDASTMALQERDLQGQPPTTTVGVFRWTGATWAHQSEIPFTLEFGSDGEDAFFFGATLGFNRAGNLLAISDAVAKESGSGVSPASMPGPTIRGAVYLWQRDARNPATWTMRSVVKSPNPDFMDGFGTSIALCGTGSTLAFSSEGEDSKAKGIDGDRRDPTAREAGAAYLY